MRSCQVNQYWNKLKTKNQIKYLNPLTLMDFEVL